MNLWKVSPRLKRPIFRQLQKLFPLFPYRYQHGFLKRKPTVTQLLDHENLLYSSLDSGKVKIVQFLDSSETFDCVAHDFLSINFASHGISVELFQVMPSFIAGW